MAFDLGSVFVTFKARLDGFDQGIDKMRQGINNVESGVEKFRNNADKIAVGMVAIGAVGAGGFMKIKGGIDESLAAANRFDSALTGLSSIARAFGHNADAARQAAINLSKDGLMSVADAATGLKNLLAAGFSLPEATILMDRFKDTAAFGRQGALQFGQAIVGATEGIKNGNSILVDNAGVTKNLSVMLEEAGFSAQDLMKATSDNNIRQAIYQGILRESNPMIGDAARLSENFAGAQARAAAATETTNMKLGKAFQPVLIKVFEVLEKVVTWIGKFAEEHPKLTAAIGISLVVLFGLLTVLGAIGGIIALVVAGFGSMGAVVVAIVVGALALLAGAATFIMLNWQDLMKWFGDFWNWLAKTATDVWNSILNAARYVWDQIWSAIMQRINMIVGGIMYLGGIINGVWNGIVAVGSGAWNAIVNGFNWARNTVINLWGSMAGWFSGVWGSITSAVGGVANAISGAFNAAMNAAKGIVTGAVNWIVDRINGMINAVNGVAGKIPGAPKLGTIPRLARGARNFAGGLAFIAEQGPELIQLPRGSNVFTAGETRAMMSTEKGGGQQIIINLDNANITSPQVANEYGEMIGDAIMRKVQSNARV